MHHLSSTGSIDTWHGGRSLDRLLGTLEQRPGIEAGGELTVSAAGNVILYSKLIGEGSDLVLIENFR